MGVIREMAEQHWDGKGDLVHAHHPVAPLRDDAGDFVAEEIMDDVFTMKSVASVNAIDTGDGLVMLDTGGKFDAERIFRRIRDWRPGAPLAAAVYSHHHIDHIFGTRLFEAEAIDNGWAAPTVYAHENLPGHLRRYQKTTGWNAAINRRQFAIDRDDWTWPDQFREPDVTFKDRIAFARGDCTFELAHDRGETDDAAWTWVPEKRLLHPGDLFIWAVPNAGNPQKVQRYLSDWAAGLRKMAALNPETMIAGHGVPIFGRDRIVEALLNTAELLDSIEDQTLAIMNQGKNLDTALHEVHVPRHLQSQPYLQAVYDEPQFLVRNVWRRYGGWHDGEPDNLLPAPRAQQASEWVALAGGADAVLARAEALAADGDHRMACHLVEYCALADPANADVWAVRGRIYRERSQQQTSTMARNILGHAATASEQGKRDLAGDY